MSILSREPEMAPPLVCPPNSFPYNAAAELCGCNPGLFYLIKNGAACTNFDAPGGVSISVGSGVSTGGVAFLSSVLPLDALRKLTQPQEEIIGTTLVTVLLWLVFCLCVRLGRVGGGETVWFRIRWGISRLDSVFSTSHWVEDLKVVRKRKTELGGMFSVASWILFVGLLSALLYQIITKRSIEVHRIRPTNVPDLLSFVNDIEFNITTISSMSCSHLRGLDRLVIGTPGSIFYKVNPLSSYKNYTCYNTTSGPMVSLKCSGCKIPREDHYISWKFVDLPNDPAVAVGFQFNLTVKSHDDDKHVSFVSGTLKSDDEPQTYRGPEMSILKIHLFPQIFNYLHNLRLIQPLLHDFLPGSSFSDVSSLRSSLQNSEDGLVKTTLYISYLSEYIVEIDREKVVGIVSFLADVGGLYSISLAIFLYFLLQFEARFKKLRTEDNVIRNIRSHRRAQRHWDMLRKYVNYTWGHSNLDMRSRSSKRHDGVLADSFCGVGSLHRIKQSSRRNAIYLDKVDSVPYEMKFAPDPIHSAKSRLAGCTTNFDGRFSDCKHEQQQQQLSHSVVGVEFESCILDENHGTKCNCC